MLRTNDSAMTRGSTLAAHKSHAYVRRPARKGAYVHHLLLLAVARCSSSSGPEIPVRGEGEGALTVRLDQRR